MTNSQHVRDVRQTLVQIIAANSCGPARTPPRPSLVHLFGAAAAESLALDNYEEITASDTADAIDDVDTSRLAGNSW